MTTLKWDIPNSFISSIQMPVTSSITIEIEKAKNRTQHGVSHDRAIKAPAYELIDEVKTERQFMLFIRNPQMIKSDK